MTILPRLKVDGPFSVDHVLSSLANSNHIHSLLLIHTQKVPATLFLSLPIQIVSLLIVHSSFDVQAFIHANLNQLVFLNLIRNDIPQPLSLPLFKKIASLPNLKRLNFNQNHTTTNMIQLLFDAPSSLDILSLAQTNINSTALNTLALFLKNRPNFKTLNISENHDLSMTAIYRFLIKLSKFNNIQTLILFQSQLPLPSRGGPLPKLPSPSSFNSNSLLEQLRFNTLVHRLVVSTPSIKHIVFPLNFNLVNSIPPFSNITNILLITKQRLPSKELPTFILLLSHPPFLPIDIIRFLFFFIFK